MFPFFFCVWGAQSPVTEYSSDQIFFPGNSLRLRKDFTNNVPHIFRHSHQNFHFWVEKGFRLLWATLHSCEGTNTTGYTSTVTIYLNCNKHRAWIHISTKKKLSTPLYLVLMSRESSILYLIKFKISSQKWTMKYWINIPNIAQEFS